MRNASATLNTHQSNNVPGVIVEAHTRAVRKRLSQKFSQQAIDQLREEVVRLHEENEQLRTELAWATDDARWARDQLNQIEDQLSESGLAMGITPSANLVVVSE